MTTATELRVALIGAGYFARYHLERRRRAPGARLAAVCNRNPARLARAAADSGGAGAYTEAGAMLAAESPDLHDIATAPQSHLALVALTARHGAAGVCQKPPAPTRAEAVRLLETAEEAGTIL